MAPSFVAIGNVLIDHRYRLTNFPRPDGGAYVTASERRLGGVENNVATLVDALGHPAGMIGQIGEDEEGKAVRERLEDSPIETDRIRQVTGVTTSYCLVLIDPEGRRTIIGGGDSTLNLRLDAADLEYVDEASVAFTSAYAPPGIVSAMADRSPTVVYDLAGEFTDLTDRGLTRETLTSLAPAIDCFVGNVAAVRSYLQSDADVPELTAMLLERGVERGAITQGSGGATLFTPSECVHVPAFAVDVVDTTGAGDAFTAGLVHAWLFEGQALRQAGRFAAATASLTCLGEGTHGRRPTRDEVSTFLSDRTD